MARDSANHDFLPSVIAAVERPPSFYARIVSGLVILLAVLAGLWAYWSRIDIVVSARGEIVPAGRVKVVQAAEAGIVREIIVNDGQIVEAGRPLIKLDNTISEADETQLQTRRGHAALTVQRLRAELGQTVSIGTGVDLPGRAIDTQLRLYQANQAHFSETIAQLRHKLEEARAAREVSRRQVDTLRSQVEYLEARLLRKRAQAGRGLIPGEEVVELGFELRTARKELEVYKAKARATGIRQNAAQENLKAVRIERSSGLYRQLAEAEHELKSIRQELDEARQRSARQILKAPVAGVVQQLSVHTIGAVVQRGQKLLVIVPEDTGLEMNAKILNKDIGFVDEDQIARVKVDAFEFTRYGHIDGRLQWVGGDAVVDQENGPVYPARISLTALSLPNQVSERKATVVPGMRATADIVIGRRRVIEYFIAPLLRYRDQSLRER